MQYWIIYRAGVGGDGFANLLEHADNIFPADGEHGWRIDCREGRHNILDRPIRFYSAHWVSDSMHPFRQPVLFDRSVLNPKYVRLIAEQKNTVIPTHVHYFDLVDQFEYQKIVKQDRVIIHLYSDRHERVYQDLITKRPEIIPYCGSLTDFVNHSKLENAAESNRSDYAMHIDIEKAWRDWSYLNNCLSELGINLDKKFYDHYLTYIDNL